MAASPTPAWLGRSAPDGTCPVTHTINVVGGRWTTLIVRELLGGTRRFGELRASQPGINPKTLTERLRRLEAQRLVERHVHAEVPPRVEYTLTERGRGMEPILAAMWQWGMDDLAAHPHPR